jgi:Cu(I)/Ag(I) efflux system membrane fusion protein
MKKYIVLATLLLFVFTACNRKKQTAAAKDEYYTCSMHPQIMQDKPGTCPICHMELIPVKKTQQAADEISLNAEQIRLGNIRTDTIRNGMMGDNMVLTATLTADETKLNSVNARISGRIDRLYFKNTGDFVSKGAHLYDLYSEELNNAKQEYLAALERQQTLGNSVINFSQLLQKAKTKLLLWGVSEAQVQELEKTKKPSPLTAFYSQASGFITEIPVTEGQYVMEGGVVVKLADLSTLWAEAQAYASQLAGLDYQGMAAVRFPDLPGKEFNGKLVFANPEINPDTRINLIRVAIPNSGNRLKPGMPAYVVLKNPEGKMLTLPSDAVLRDSKMFLVWIKTGRNRFKSRMVQTGVEDGYRVEIKSGLQNGDIVVTNGAYLLQSEYIFKKGADPMAGHDMGNRKK